MTAMPPTSGHSAACCNVPPVVTTGYEKKGKYEQLGGLKTCKPRFPSQRLLILPIGALVFFLDHPP